MLRPSSFTLEAHLLPLVRYLSKPCLWDFWHSDHLPIIITASEQASFKHQACEPHLARPATLTPQYDKVMKSKAVASAGLHLIRGFRRICQPQWPGF
jgi:hypothetical protein